LIRKSLTEFAARTPRRNETIFAAACTWQKILLSLQVSKMGIYAHQGIAAGCKLSQKTAQLFFE